MIDLSTGLLILRLVVGAVMFAHGAQKVLGAFGGGGMSGVEGMMTRLGMRPPKVWALIAAWSEFGGGALLFMGFLTPVAAAAIAAAMLMAIALVHYKNGFWNSAKGYEYNLVVLGAAVALLFTGPGRHSVDYSLGIYFAPWLAILVAVGAAAGVVFAFMARRQPPGG